MEKFIPNLSKDYNRLFDLLIEGYRVPCYATYSGNEHADGGQPLRDICEAQRFGDYDIIVGARGITYGGVKTWHPTQKRFTDKTEREIFIEDCERMSLEWVDFSPLEISGDPGPIPFIIDTTE